MTFTAPPWWEERLAFQRTAADPAGLIRMAAELVPDGTVRLRGRLRGGTETAVSAIDLVDRSGTTVRAVLKRRRDPQFDGAGEWAALAAAASAAVPTPEPLGFDPTGRWFDRPALVMSRLSGRAHLDVSADPATLAQIARALVAVHDCDGAGLAETKPRWTRVCPPDASDFERRVWKVVHALGRDCRPATSLVHLDFHPANTLWFRNRLSGVIDWENGARGWPGEDVAKCRAYLVLIHGLDAADGFRRAYEAEIGGPVPLLALSDLSYCIGLQRQSELRAFAMRETGFPDMTEALFRQRLQELMESALRHAEGLAPRPRARRP